MHISTEKFKNIYILLYGIVIFCVIYLQYILKGGFVSDDWVVVDYIFSNKNFFEVFMMSSGGFRPLFGIYWFIVTSLFGSWVVGYILFNLFAWSLFSVLLYQLLKKHFDLSFYIYWPFSLMPTFASSVIFSPAVQTIIPLSLLLWVISLYYIDFFSDRREKKFFVLSLIFIFFTMMTYESSLPLLILNAWVLYKKQVRFISASLITYCFFIGFIVLSVVIYQKSVIPWLNPSIVDISRLQFKSLSGLFLKFANDSLIMLKLLILDIPGFFISSWKSIFYYPSIAIELAIILLLVFFGLMIEPKKNKEPKCSTRQFLLLMSLVLTGIIIMYTPTVFSPDFVGYINRGFVCFSIFFIILVSSVFFRLFSKRNMFIVVIFIIPFFSMYYMSFLFQRNNYLLASDTIKTVIEDIQKQKRVTVAPISDQSTPAFILGNVPDFLLSNFNNEVVFDNEYYTNTWGWSLILFSNGKLHGIPINQNLVNRGSVKITENKLVIDGFSILLDKLLKNCWYYEYRQDIKVGNLIQVRDQQQLESVIQHVRGTDLRSGESRKLFYSSIKSHFILFLKGFKP